MNNPDLLREEYTIDTPENVTFGYTVAGIGSRFVGALVDTLLIVLLLLFLNVLVGTLLAAAPDSNAPVAADGEPTPDRAVGLAIALYALLNFAVIWGYYLIFELTWNGQTPGKRLAGTQVVKVDGAPAGFLESAIRNLVRIVDFMPFAYALGVVVMFFNRQSRRLGDYAAGTLVIKHQRALQLEQIGALYSGSQAAASLAAASEQQTALHLRFPLLRQLAGADYQTIREALARDRRRVLAPELLCRLAIAIAAKVGAPTPAPDVVSARQFLEEVSAAYQQLGALTRA